MAKPRLYNGPPVTESVLRSVVKGATTQKELAEEMGCAEQTVFNHIHDPIYLGLLESDGKEYSITDEDDVMRLLQLEDRSVLKERFLEMPGVEEVREELNGGQLPFKRIGQLISYHTDSKAIEVDTFKYYGRIYAKWFQYLSMGYAGKDILYSEKPLDFERIERRQPKGAGSGSPKVRPEKVFTSLELIAGGVSGPEEIAEHFDFSKRSGAKVLSTCYALGLAEREDDGVVLTDYGRKVLKASEEQRRELIRVALLEINLVETYFELAPNESFWNQELMKKVCDELGNNWSETTIKTKAKRLYSWLVYSDLFKEVKQGKLIKSASVDGSGSGEGQKSVDSFVRGRS